MNTPTTQWPNSLCTAVDKPTHFLIEDGAVSSRQSAVGSRQSAVGSRQSAVGSRQSAVGSQQSAVSDVFAIVLVQVGVTRGLILLTVKLRNCGCFPCM